MIPELVASFDRTTAYVQGLVADLRDEDMSLAPPRAPNHATWTLGHLAYSFQEIARELGSSPWLPEGWERSFGCGSLPADAARSPFAARQVLMGRFEDARGRLGQLLLATGEDRLKEPLPDPKSREVLPTLGDALLQIVAAHSAYHAGQLAAWRRAIGRGSVGVFV